MSQSNGVERELKFREVDHNQLREQLESFEAECTRSSALEDNWIFDNQDHLLQDGKVLRLRVDRRGTRLTFKGPAKFDGKVKVRAEHQTVIEDEKQIRLILESLGFSVVRRYQKYREEWRLGAVIITLDHTPIGDFAEFEGDGCERVAKRCGLDPEDAERRSYLRLYEDYRKENPEAPPFMVFS